MSPVLLLGAIAAMTGERPLARGAAFALGAALPLAALTAIALLLGRALSLPEASDPVKGAIDIGFGALLVVLGARALRPSPKPAEPKHRAEGSPGRYVGLGAGLIAHQRDHHRPLPAGDEADQRELGRDRRQGRRRGGSSSQCTLAFVLVPLAVVAIAPNAAGRMLSATGAWLGTHRRTLTLVICFGLGAYLVVHGLARVL